MLEQAPVIGATAGLFVSCLYAVDAAAHPDIDDSVVAP